MNDADASKADLVFFTATILRKDNYMRVRDARLAAIDAVNTLITNAD
jgi:hypothetical protein